MVLQVFLFSCDDLKTTGFLFLIREENEQLYEKGGHSLFWVTISRSFPVFKILKFFQELNGGYFVYNKVNYNNIYLKYIANHNWT